MTSTKTKYVGGNATRHDGFEKVTGTGLYAADIKVNGMIYGKLKTSPHAHAKILSIDTSKAEALPGVRAVITGKEANYRVGIYMTDRYIMAVDRVRYYGEAVAAVAADTLEIAEKAVDLIEVAYEQLPVINDVREAIKPDAPLLHEEMETYTWTEGVFFPEIGTNIASHIKMNKGDVEKGFHESDYIIENTFSIPQIFHVPMETHSLIVQWASNDKVTVYSSAQSPFALRDLFAHTFNIPRHKIEVNIPYIGGGFGGKSGIHLEPLVGLLSKYSGGKPVKLVLTREEEMTVVPCRQGVVTRIKTGVRKDGRIIAQEIEHLWDAGAYADYGVNIGRNGGAINGPGPYCIENIKVNSKTIYTNHLFGTAYRGFGYPEASWGLERQMDIVAKHLGMDPYEFRLMNLLKVGSTTVTGEVITEYTGSVRDCIAKAAQAIKLHEEYSEEEKAEFKRTGKYKGKAVAVLQKSPAMPTWSASSALIHLNEDGTVKISVGGTDIGQGSYTMLQQIVAEKLDIPIERIHISHKINTDMSPYDWQTVASRMTVICGNAVVNACDDLLDQIYEMGAIALRAAKHELAVADGFVYVKQKPQNRIPFSQIAIGYVYENGNAVGGPIIGRGKAIAQGLSNLDPETGYGTPAMDWTYGAQGVEIEVDTHTGDIEVLHLATSIDVGKVMHKGMFEGQVLGGSLQAIGATFYEYIQYDDFARMRTDSFVDYKIPTMKDIPHRRSILPIENPQLDGPYGARGAGEHPTVSVACAIGNALENAIGVDIIDLPMTSWNVLERIQMQNNAE